MSWLRLVVATVILVGLAAGIVPDRSEAQTARTSIGGLVIDPSGALVPGASVVVTNVETNETRSVESGSTGSYDVALLAAGRYRIEIERTGYKRFVTERHVTVGESSRLDAQLEIGSVTEQIDVAAYEPLVRRDSPMLATMIDNDQISNLPLDGRNFLELSLLAPGTAPPAQGSAGSVRGEFAFNVNGAREDSNSFLLDGAYNLDPELNSAAVTPPVDAIREFQIVTGSHDASFGRNAGGQVNVVLKSGTNQLHGTAYEFFRSNRLDARNAFAARNEPHPEYRRHQFGASLGAPLVRDRTFVFADYEGTRVREGVTRITTVPTAAERLGDFSASRLAPPINPFTGQPFPGGALPPFFLHPAGQAIAALYPLPNRPGSVGNFVSSPIQRDRNDLFDVRLDQQLGASGLSVRYSFADRDLFEPFAAASLTAVPGFGNDVERRAQNVVATLTSVLSPAWANEARVAFTRVSGAVTQEGGGSSLNRQVGLPELSADPRDFGLSLITVTGFSPLGHEANSPQASTTNSLQLADNATYTPGRHLLKFGADFRATSQDAFRDVQSRGFLTFSDRFPFTGNALADLLLGVPALTGGARLDNPQRLRTYGWSAYAQDHWRVGRSVTVSAGVRYEYNAVPVDADDRATIYDVATGRLVAVGQGGVPRGGYEDDRNNWAPRAGVTWTPGESGATVLRGGYGVYYDQSSLAPGEGLYFNAPFFDFNLFFPLPGLLLTVDDPFPAFYPIDLPQSALTYQRDLRTPFLHHWNVGVQQELGAGRAVEVAYVGTAGRNLISARDINQPDPSPIPQLRPNPRFDDITIVESRATSRYDSLQVRFQQRVRGGLAALTSYTLAKSTDDASSFFASAGDPNFPQDSRNPGAERGRSNFDVRHRFSLALSYQLPLGTGGRWLADRGWMSAFLADWQLQSIVTLQTGRPFTVALLPEIDNSNTGRSVLGFGANDRPNVSGDPAVADPSADRWFDTGAFVVPPRGQFGNVGRNTLEGPGFRNVNLGLLKHVGLASDARLQIRLEAFNLLNTVNLDLPDAFVGSPTFGRVLSAGSPRRIQIGAKLLF